MVWVPYQEPHWGEAGHCHSSWTWPICSWNLWINVQVCGFAPPARGWLLHNMFSSCKFTVSLGISLPVLRWLLSTFQACSELPVPGALGFPRTLFSSVVNTEGGLAGSQRDLEISVMCDQGLTPSSMWSQPVQGRQGVLNSSWSSSVQSWSWVRTSRDRSAPSERRGSLSACFLDFLKIPTV